MGEWSPCDNMPVLYVQGSGKLKLLKKKEIIENCEIYDRKKHGDARPEYAMMPHYNTCPVLKQERYAWAKSQRG